MKFKSFKKIFLIIGLVFIVSPALAQEAQPTELPACESETFDSMLYVVECAKENCPYAKQQQGLYEMICAETNPGEMLRRRGFDELLDKVGGVEPLPAAKNTPTLAPCDCLAKLDEKFTCDIPTCATPAAPQNGPQKTDTLPASQQATAGGCSFASTPAASHNYFMIAAFALGLSFLLGLKFFKNLKWMSALSMSLMLACLVACGSASESGVADGTKDPASPNSAAAPSSSPSGKWLAAYYPSYRQFEMPPSAFDYTAMTHLIHWPVLPRADGTLDTASTDFSVAHSQDVVSRAHAAGIKVLLGVGGNTDSGATAGFQGAAGTAANRAIFVKQMVALMQSRGYDGIDINWEEIRPQDDAAFVSLIRELRQALESVSPRPLLTMPPTTGFDARPELIAQVQQELDQINLQTYVMSGAYLGWVTWHNSPLANGGFEFPAAPGEKLPSIDEEVERFVKAGIALNKMAIGVQFDAFIWSGGSGTDTGGVTKPRQSWNTAPKVDLIPYKNISKLLAEGYQEHFDTVAKVPYLSLDSAKDSEDRFVSFDNEQGIAEKAEYLQAKGLGGMFIFEIAGDYLPGQAQTHPLLNAAKEALLK